MAEALTGPDWATPLSVPTVARNDQSYRSGEFWRGDVWPAPDYQSGLRQGVAHLGMTGVVLTMALDGLTARHRIAVAP